MGFKKIANTKELTRSIFSKIKHRSWIARKKISFPTQNVISFLFNNAFKKGVDVRKRDFGREDRYSVARRYPLPIARFPIQARSNSHRETISSKSAASPSILRFDLGSPVTQSGRGTDG